MKKLVANQKLIADVAYAIHLTAKRFDDKMGLESPTACAKAALQVLSYEIVQEEKANG